MPSIDEACFDLFGGIPKPSSSMFQDICLFCEEHAADVNASLPWLMAEIGHNDSYGTMLRFVRSWGGIRIYVSKDYDSFVGRVGYRIGTMTHRRILVDVGTASQVEVPSAWGVFLALRRAAITIAVRSGLPAKDIARRFGVTMRSLR